MSYGDRGTGTYVLLPLPKACFLRLDLLGEALAEGLFFLLELGVFELARLLLAKLAHLHLSLAVVLVVELLGHGDQIKHVGTDQQRAQLAEVAVVLILNYGRVVSVDCTARRRKKRTLGNTPQVFAPLDNPAVRRGHVLRGTNDREWQRRDKYTGVLGRSLIIGVDGRLVDTDALGRNHFTNL